MSHTPGPWKLIADGSCGFVYASEPNPEPRRGRPSEINSFECRVQSWNSRISDDEIRANAQLIAAAPDLLAALKWALSDEAGFACPAATEDRMIAAIEKAEGKGSPS